MVIAKNFLIFVKIGDFNVIRVGWIGGSLTLNYAKSATDTQVVGAEIGLFVKNILVSNKKIFHELLIYVLP